MVTGYDDDGRYTTTELWVSDRGPIRPGDADPSTREWALEPPPGGACFRQNRAAEPGVMIGVLVSAR